MTSVAVDFVTAIENRNGKAACALLTDNAAHSVSGATDTSCEQAALNVDESGTAVGEVQVWGDAAQVHVGDDVVFLRRGDTWQVQAAGCTSDPPGPYDCDVDG
ncbi:MAG: hypothetical protein ABJA87_05395 [bacterium]